MYIYGEMIISISPSKDRNMPEKMLTAFCKIWYERISTLLPKIKSDNEEKEAFLVPVRTTFKRLPE